MFASFAAPAPAISAAQQPNAAATVACPTVAAQLVATIDTKIVVPGALFSFRTTQPVALDGTPIPAGTGGTGIVATLDHSKSHGESGYLVLEARYLELSGGEHVPVTFVPGGDGRSDAFVRAGSSDAPGFLGYVPYVGTAASIYDYFHHGKDAAVVAGAAFELVVGDAYMSGRCTVTSR